MKKSLLFLLAILCLAHAARAQVPAASPLLADWGADIVKIEPVERGDAMRGLASTGVAVVPDNVHVKLSKNFPLLTTTEMLAGHSRASRPLPVKNVGSSFTENMREPSQHGSN